MSHSVSLWIYCERCGRPMEIGFELTTAFGSQREGFQQPWECPYDDCHRRQSPNADRTIARACSRYPHRVWDAFVDRVNAHLARIFEAPDRDLGSRGNTRSSERS
jgi:hypothetical protein